MARWNATFLTMAGIGRLMIIFFYQVICQMTSYQPKRLICMSIIHQVIHQIYRHKFSRQEINDKYVPPFLNDLESLISSECSDTEHHVVQIYDLLKHHSHLPCSKHKGNPKKRSIYVKLQATSCLFALIAAMRFI